jgi:hypothetical protein
MDKFTTLTSNINVYDVFGKCWTTTTSPFLNGHHHKHEERMLQSGKNYMTAAEYTPFLNRFKRTGDDIVKMAPPCVYAKPIQDYFRNDTVKTALHVSADANAWDYCADINYTSGVNASYDIYVALKGKYKILKYSGDTDGAVPTYGT